MPRTTRKSLKVLQHTASDTENLVGRPSKTLKHQLTQETPVEVEVKRKNLSKEKETQVNLENKITADDLTNPDGPSTRYWQILAEKRQVALQEMYEENEKLRKMCEDLKQDLVRNQQLLDEANSFVEVIKEELANAGTDDTGIDVNDVSTAEETAEDETDLDASKDQ
ncbi:geminin [Bicyclus anynana]|uniref:Geminin n=1 Tax=Bicyclus anynana TaxID=110368 RepID=A0A6J1MWB0_BICAN|nr:geminin [Bicyclus anynana]